MLYPAANQSANANKTIAWFLLCWTVLNLLQAATLGLHSDEAYYWVYSRFLDWGYFDHPPMVALFIRAGDSLLHTELGVRLAAVISSTASIYVLWLIAKKFKTDARWFVLMVSGTFIFHIYGFITTPDAPLLLFTVLFYYVYQQYLEKDKWALALLLALIVAGLLYSKYHGILLVLFTVLANIRLLKRPSFYLIAVLSLILYLPHIVWQVHHHYPSVAYHLFERSSEVYQPSHTYLYLPGQLLMAGPLTGWFIFYYAFTTRVKGAFIRCLLVNSAGTFFFFLINTIKGNVQPHWTLIGFVPLVLLVIIHLRQPGSKPAWLFKLAVANTVLIILFRLLLIVHEPHIIKLRAFRSFYGFAAWAQQIRHKAGNAYVIIPASFQEPSKYNFYTRSLKGFDYDERTYRRTQYDLWPIEDSMQHRRVMLLTDRPVAGQTTDSVSTSKGRRYISWINNVLTLQKLDIQISVRKLKARPGEAVPLTLSILNPYSAAVNFGEKSQGKPITLSACFYQDKDLVGEQPAGADVNRLVIAAHQTGIYRFKLTAPAKPGQYDLIFSVRTAPFPGGRNSRMITFTAR